MGRRAVFLVVFFALAFTSCQKAAETNELILIPAGPFLMGADGGRASNQPQRNVFLDAFTIQQTEVTRSQFLEFLAATGYLAAGWQEPEPDRGNLPATGILWRDAAAYCEWLGLRLPTEAEWEKAARGADGRMYPWGNEWDPEFTNGDGRFNTVQLVGSYPQGASPYGLLDMSGNASEWVPDYYDAAYYTYAPTENPQGPQTVLDHILRGGSFASPPEQLTTFFRNSSHSVLPNPRVGFRCAASVEDVSP